LGAFFSCQVERGSRTPGFEPRGQAPLPSTGSA